MLKYKFNFGRGLAFTIIFSILLLLPGVTYAQDTTYSILDTTNSMSIFYPKYDQTQNSSVSDVEKIQNVVDAYFLEQLESRKTNTIPEWDYLFEFSTQGQALYKYETGKLHYRLIGEKYINTAITWYEYNPKYENVLINANDAQVKISGTAKVKFANSGKLIENIGQDLHEISLIKVGESWKIRSDKYDDEMKLAYPDNTNWDKLISEFYSTMASIEQQDNELYTRIQNKSETDWRLKSRYKSNEVSGDSSLAPLGYVTLDHAKAAWYGNYYTDDSGSSEKYDAYNQLFKWYYHNDCQNFVSQALWYGFGGSNDATSIGYHFFPMVDWNMDPNPHDWWNDKYYTDGNNMWINVDYFKSYIIDNYNNNKHGVQGTVGSIGGIEPGDYLYAPGHVILVTDVIDYDGDGYTDFNEIYISAHTNNRQHHRLSDLYSPTYGFTYMWIMGYQN